MSFFEKKPKLFQILIGALAVLGFIVSSSKFHGFATSPTDDNWFRSPPSNLYVIKTFPARLTQFNYIEGEAVTPRTDSIRIGDLILFVNGRSQGSLEELNQTLATIPEDSVFRLDVFRPQENKDFDYEVRRTAVPDSFVIQLGSTAFVYDVFPGGASDQAGMKPGDLIQRINGQSFEDIYEADQFTQRASSGEIIDYQVLRKNRVLTLQIEIANFGVPLPVILLTVSGLIFAGLGVFLGIQRPELIAARLIGIAFLLLGFALLTSFSRDAEFDSISLLRGVESFTALIFGIAVWIHSWSYFPKQRPELLAHIWQPVIPYLIASIAFVLSLLLDIELALLAKFAVTAMAIYFIILSIVQRKERTVEYTKMNRSIMLTVGSVLLVFLVLQITSLGLREFTQAGVMGILFVLIPLAYLYTIGRYRLLELHLQIHTSLQYTILTVIWGIAVVGTCIFLLISLAQLHLNFPNIHFTGNTFEIRDSPLSESRRVLFQNLILMVIAIGLTSVFWKLRKAGQKFVDTKYYRGLHNYQAASNELAEVMDKNFDLVELANGLVNKLAAVMHLRRVGVLIFHENQPAGSRQVYGLSASEWEKFCQFAEERILKVMQGFSSETRFSVDYLPEELRQEFERHEFRHIIPIRSREKLVGVLLVGGKMSEAPFVQEDLSFLNGTAKQASVSIENAFLYQQLAEQERFKLELEIARRIQLESLPQSTPTLDHLEIAGISIPATEVGGDYFDYLNGYPDSVTIIVGDVSGKGTSAALYMSKIQGILRSLQTFNLSPRELFVRANVLLCKDLEKRSFITAIGVTIRASHRELVLARAGHLPLYHFRSKSKKIDQVIPKGLGLGLDNADIFAAQLEETIIRFESGDVFLLITDGITEARDGNEVEYGEDQLTEILKNSNSESAKVIRDEIIASVKRFTGNRHQHDDQTVVVVKAL